jgi:hypothetical protein
MTSLARCCGLAVGLALLLGLTRTASAQVRVVDKELQDRINKAIEKGVKYIKSVQRDDGTWPYAANNHTPGSTALAGWALLESGVKADDPAIKKAAAYLRRAAILEQQVYHISLMIFFFDKLGDAEDVPIIESLGLRLMQSQCMDGGWTYQVPPLVLMGMMKNGEQKRLETLIANRKGGAGHPKLPRKVTDLAQQIRAQLAMLRPNMLGQADNSNTQFAMIALWVAKRYGLPAQKALQAVQAHFERSQAEDGSWAYMNRPGITQRSNAMACAGLLGLFVGVTSNPLLEKAPNLKQRLQEWNRVQAGFKYLAWVMRNPQKAGEPDGKFFYFLWSMERVGMAYDIKMMSGVDWYKWGATWLVDQQGIDGSWRGAEYAVGECDTSFALLFLKRANVLKAAFPSTDLTVGITEPKSKPKTKPKEDLPLDLPTVVPDKKDGAGKDKKSGGGRSSALPSRRDGALAALAPVGGTCLSRLPNPHVSGRLNAIIWKKLSELA